MRLPVPLVLVRDGSLLWSHSTQLQAARFQHRARAQVSLICAKLQRPGSHSIGVRRTSFSRPHQASPSGPFWLRLWPQPRAVGMNGPILSSERSKGPWPSQAPRRLGGKTGSRGPGGWHLSMRGYQCSGSRAWGWAPCSAHSVLCPPIVYSLSLPCLLSPSPLPLLFFLLQVRMENKAMYLHTVSDRDTSSIFEEPFDGRSLSKLNLCEDGECFWLHLAVQDLPCFPTQPRHCPRAGVGESPH